MKINLSHLPIGILRQSFQSLAVLFEQPKNGKFFGHAPNYMEVLVDGAELHNALKNVRIIDVDGEALLGEIVEQEAEA